MKKIIFIAIILFARPCFSQGLEEIFSDPERFDQKQVCFEAEVIGEVLANDSGFWLNVSEAGYNLGVYLKNREKAEVLGHFGSYRETGDRVRMTGVFYRDCPLHHECGLHLDDLEVIESGYIRRESVSAAKLKLSLVLAIICLTLGGIYLIKEHYGKRN